MIDKIEQLQSEITAVVDDYKWTTSKHEDVVSKLSVLLEETVTILGHMAIEIENIKHGRIN